MDKDNTKIEQTTEKQRHPGSENLVPLNQRTPEERAEIARMGGIASGESKERKRLLSEAYAEVLKEEYEIEEGASLKGVIKAIIRRGDAPSVSMLKEIREATEGSKTALTGPDGGPIQMTINIIGVEPETDECPST